LSGNRGTANAMAARGLTGGSLASGLAENERVRNEAQSGAATDIEIEGAKKLIKRILDTMQGTTEQVGTQTSIGSQTGQSTGTQTQTSQGTSTGQISNNEGDFSNQLGDLLGLASGGMLGNSSNAFSKWLSGLGGTSSGSTGSSLLSSSTPTFGSAPSNYFSSMLSNLVG
jgi:hypothetical protein